MSNIDPFRKPNKMLGLVVGLGEGDGQPCNGLAFHPGVLYSFYTSFMEFITFLHRVC